MHIINLIGPKNPHLIVCYLYLCNFNEAYKPTFWVFANFNFYCFIICLSRFVALYALLESFGQSFVPLSLSLTHTHTLSLSLSFSLSHTHTHLFNSDKVLLRFCRHVLAAGARAGAEQLPRTRSEASSSRFSFLFFLSSHCKLHTLCFFPLIFQDLHLVLSLSIITQSCGRRPNYEIYEPHNRYLTIIWTRPSSGHVRFAHFVTIFLFFLMFFYSSPFFRTAVDFVTTALLWHVAPFFTCKLCRIFLFRFKSLAKKSIYFSTRRYFSWMSLVFVDFITNANGTIRTIWRIISYVSLE